MHFLKTGENQFKYLTFLTDFFEYRKWADSFGWSKGKQHKIVI